MKRFSLILSVLLPLTLLAQETMTITGRITNFETGEAMPGSNVMIIGMPLGAAASASGLYRIEIPLTRIKTDSITISVNHIGYKSAVLTIPVLAGPNMMDFYLTTDAIVMKEVVKRADAWVESTRAEKARDYHAVIINLDEIRQSGAGDPIEILRGKIAGIVINNAGGGMLGSVPLIQMRGQMYLTSLNTQPLLVVDGIPFVHDYSPSGKVMDTILDIGIMNIATIEVVKGQGMYWRYGREAANGYILITSKKSVLKK